MEFTIELSEEILNKAITMFNNCKPKQEIINCLIEEYSKLDMSNQWFETVVDGAEFIHELQQK